MPLDFIQGLYAASLELTDGRPISIVAAERLAETVGRGDVVMVLTGAGVSPILPKGESDGPPGAAAVARALYRGLGAVPTYVLEKHHVEPVVASSESIGLMVKNFDEAKNHGLGACVEVAPPMQEGVPEWVEKTLEKYNPKAIFCTERIGPAKNGELHGATGIPLSRFNSTPGAVVDTSPLVVEAKKRGILTIGVGDLGNEIGFGAIYDTVAKIIPNGPELATTTATDIVYPVMMSNWGAYGIEAALAFVLEKPELLRTQAQEARLLRACLDAGGLEAAYCTTDFFVDGLDGETSMAVVHILGTIVRKYLEPIDTGLAH
ncbi:glutamate cyclase domain-containing protein [Pontibacter sp. G13]|uniref:glutamate cyclase domain-containing protein n=1 Tax=Pontibacter sp. G13 TaxID=3074898 RepID=UPI0028893E06|nr:glutamate cyclase domain-containing protein [Pontibacter sp. G13]WNJ18265.1 DUF4392 domain-containing protein [Pontibacter sp. G13]